MSSDFKVSRRYQDEVADEAAGWRRLDDTGNGANHFDIIAFLIETVLPTLSEAGRHITIEIIEDDRELDKAWVDFAADRLFVQQYIWDAAKRQEAFGRLVLAHEIGHLALHRDQVFAFSRGLEAKLNFLEPSESAECQANWFAEALLLPDDVVLRMRHLSASSIGTLTLVSDRVAQRRIDLVQGDKRYRRDYTGDACSECHNFTMVRTGTCLKCDTCGTTTDYS
ncbi:MAG: ImmA/IrrE family metallo-endopeptidase [Devosia nanyangense]|uniref:ImmA/IrrE family metallo-endopeptidase n=1 Tax=Devosia nanyangense TaxID=1228055 RepID=A0A933L1U5_9HYPH|nr:ImmA/IrrE family metallo-endopeptidase [Devosia nanyangense]